MVRHLQPDHWRHNISDFQAYEDWSKWLDLNQHNGLEIFRARCQASCEGRRGEKRFPLGLLLVVFRIQRFYHLYSWTPYEAAFSFQLRVGLLRMKWTKGPVGPRSKGFGVGECVYIPDIYMLVRIKNTEWNMWTYATNWMLIKSSRSTLGMYNLESQSPPYKYEHLQCLYQKYRYPYPSPEEPSPEIQRQRSHSHSILSRRDIPVVNKRGHEW